jgi:ketosteroid isomerase-like protein
MKRYTMDNQQLIRQAYAAFNARDIDAALKLMHLDVKWPKAWEGDHANGHQEVREYWKRQWQEIDPKVTPETIVERPNGTLAVTVHQLVKDLNGHVIFDGTVLHVYAVEGGLIREMQIA